MALTIDETAVDVMERGIYFDGWYKNNHCYHPSLPLRSMQMIEDLEKYRGTLLVWAALGGGSISLPYLEHEAFGEVDPRLRFYGFMNDSEFIKECDKRGIKVFAVVFEVQGWEMPAIIDEYGNFKALNVIGDEEPHDWYGLREFSNGRHDTVFGKTIKDYFPEGLTNSAGEKVTDLWSECAAVDYKGIPIHAKWVEVKGHKQVCYQTCRNNPVWREYLKKIIGIQVDAGAHGIQLDECELPLTSLKDGGCFCRDCKLQFADYLKELRRYGKLSGEYSHINPDDFDYGEFLKSNGIPFPADKHGIPLFREYWEFQLRAVKRYFTELADFARSYGREKYGKEILVSGNFFNLMPVYLPIRDEVDVVITEMEQTSLKLSYWYRYAAGFAGEKPVIVAENPYGGIIPELLEMLDRGKGCDLYRIFLLEASAYGCNMSVPYGGWMGNTIRDAFYPPRHVTTEIQGFLADNERLFSRVSGANIAVLYSWPSNYWSETAGKSRIPFWESIKMLSDMQVVYNVITLADGELCDDGFSISDLNGIELVVAPDCAVLTENQADVLMEYVRSGRKLITLGRIGENKEGMGRELFSYPNVMMCRNFGDKEETAALFKQEFGKAYSDVWQVRVSDPGVGVHTHKNPGCRSLHLINYNYDKSCDSVKDIPSLDAYIGSSARNVRVHTLNGRNVEFTVEIEGGITKVTLKNVPLYTVVEFQA